MRINLKTRGTDTSCLGMKSNLQSRHYIVKRSLWIDKTIEKVRSRFFWINLSRNVKKFIRECFDCQKVKPPKVYCKPKLVPLAPARTLQLVTMDMAGPLPITKDGLYPSI